MTLKTPGPDLCDLSDLRDLSDSTAVEGPQVEPSPVLSDGVNISSVESNTAVFPHVPERTVSPAVSESDPRTELL